MEDARLEQRKKELQKQQIEKRKADAIQKAKAARDMIAENRKRVAIESELLKNKSSDPAYRRKLQQVTARRGTDINKEMEDFALQREMVEYPNEDLRMYATKSDLEQLEELEKLQKYYQDLIAQ